MSVAAHGGRDRTPETHRRIVAIERTIQRYNEQIRISPVRVISADGTQLGVLSTDEALALARKAELDLVEVAPDERPSVCRIMDYGKFKYQQQKKRKDKIRGSAHQTKNKEIRVRPKTDRHDIEFKVAHAREFLEHKDKVTISVMFRGRELAHMEEGMKVLNKVVEQLSDIAKVEKEPSQHGRRLVCILAPK